MMKLLIDMGNSTLKWTTVSNGVLSSIKSLEYEDFAHHLKAEWSGLEKPGSIFVSCVAHEQQWQELSKLSNDLWAITPQRIISAEKGFGVVNAYSQFEALGSDRWATLIAAHKIYKKDACIVDCGTAMTIDLLRADGQHLGGVIVPGADMMQRSLQTSTAAIEQSMSQLAGDEKSEYWGNNTQSGIIKGSWQALAGAVKQLYGEFQKESDKPICVLCGGGAEQLANYLDIEVQLESELVLKGLAVIAGENISV